MEAQEIMKVDSWLAINPEGALWYRGLATEPDDPTGGPFAALLTQYGAKRFVTGHTPQASRSITVRFGGRAVLIDTGMLASCLQGPRVGARNRRRQADRDLRRRREVSLPV